LWNCVVLQMDWAVNTEEWKQHEAAGICSVIVLDTGSLPFLSRIQSADDFNLRTSYYDHNAEHRKLCAILPWDPHGIRRDGFRDFGTIARTTQRIRRSQCVESARTSPPEPGLAK
jgi:hypothetical protein